MKKIIVLGAFLISTLSMNAQEANVSLSGALEFGQGESLTFGLNLDLNYLWEASEKFDFGLTAGYHYYFKEDYQLVPSTTIDVPDFSFLPLAAAARFNATEKLTFGADIGYALGISPSGNNGGFYYAPKVQFGVTPTLDIVFAYKVITFDGGGSFDVANIGLEFGF
ncbi:hypothetical protein G3567_03135 [Psychroflexus sp. YR1-1]|uniref:Outer membrane protein beta-barrel domain-containing protein n=1 Tax=Psychroflexus aurantiacus TaxID=2709310 RepID=A0A6B3QZ82_9FLAO|nr:hypothetical protein [Psychroflexus aurantiacus]NEV93142.1 hypothetical protein [Psychroflexus aurantiacus]